jgi:hypothetical protein
VPKKRKREWPKKKLGKWRKTLKDKRKNKNSRSKLLMTHLRRKKPPLAPRLRPKKSLTNKSKSRKRRKGDNVMKQNRHKRRLPINKIKSKSTKKKKKRKLRTRSKLGRPKCLPVSKLKSWLSRL